MCKNSLSLCKDSIDSIPAEIEQFTALEKLELGGNSLTYLPDEIGNLARLKILGLFGNKFSSFPQQIMQLTALIELSLYDNQLSSLPKEIGRLTTLEHLELGGNSLAYLPAEIGNLAKLKILGLSENEFSSLPKGIGQLIVLTELDLNRNQLASLSDEIGQLKALKKLDLAHNQLEALPASFAELSDLVELSLSHNNLEALPGKFVHLKSLDLGYDDAGEAGSYNRFTTLPAEIGKFTSLTSLRVDHNRLISIPADIGLLTNLNDLRLMGNKLSSLPKEIGQLTALDTLDLTNNRLRSLPSDMGNLKKLGQLFLDCNELTAIPAELGGLLQLCDLYLRGNQLTALPSSLFSLHCNLLINDNAFSLDSARDILKRVNVEDYNGPYIEPMDHMNYNVLVTAKDLPSIVTRWKTGLVKLSEEVKNDSNDLWNEKSMESANPLYNDLATFLLRLLNVMPLDSDELDPILQNEVNDILSAMEEEYSKSKAQDAGGAANSKSSFIDVCLSAANIGVGTGIGTVNLDQVKLGFVFMQLHYQYHKAEVKDPGLFDAQISMVNKIVSFVEGCANGSVIFDERSQSFKSLETCVEEPNEERGASVIKATRPNKHIPEFYQMENMLQLVYDLLPLTAPRDFYISSLYSIKHGSKEFKAAKEFIMS